MDRNEIREIAVYGKGGIGKSTISANISAALAAGGARVLQIGCDPKHDSTRLLMRGKDIQTVLEYLREVSASAAEVSEILHTGFLNVGCIEAGGPKPGVGCAGRGIISAFEFLEKYHVKEDYEKIIYDVLGDVVCGGFAVPVRREYADAVFLVTSGEYMSIYAANNILKGIRNYDGDTYKRVAGILFNERLLEDEYTRIHRFADAVGLPILAKIPRSNLFQEAEERKITLMEMTENWPEAYREKSLERRMFMELAEKIQSGIELYEAKPLEDAILEQVVMETRILNVPKTNVPGEEGCLEKGFEMKEAGNCDSKDSGEKGAAMDSDTCGAPSNRMPLYGCAFNGAATAGIHLKDSILIAHSPKACGFLTWQNMSSSGRRNLFNRGILMPSAIVPHFTCTDMNENEVVFGGMDKLRKAVADALLLKPKTIIVISACVSGIIGDDIQSVEAMSTEDTQIIAVRTDGDIRGDYMEGIRYMMHTLAERIIDPEVEASGRSVNIINEIAVSNNLSLNYDIIKGILSAMGIQINCRFLGDATTEELRNFKKAPLNILANSCYETLELRDWLVDRYQVQFMDEPFPIGFHSSEKWLQNIGAYFHSENQINSVVERERIIYQDSIRKLRPVLQGKKVLMTTINSELDWLIEAAKQAGIDFVWIGVSNYLHTDLNITRHPEWNIPIEEYYDLKTVRKRIQETGPDFVISNYISDTENEGVVLDTMTMAPVVGFQSGIYVLKRWAELLQTNRKGDWQNDRKLFEKYYS